MYTEKVMYQDAAEERDFLEKLFTETYDARSENCVCSFRGRLFASLRKWWTDLVNDFLKWRKVSFWRELLICKINFTLVMEAIEFIF